jgi:hypothetical protein
MSGIKSHLLIELLRCNLTSWVQETCETYWNETNIADVWERQESWQSFATAETAAELIEHVSMLAYELDIDDELPRVRYILAECVDDYIGIFRIFPKEEA